MSIGRIKLFGSFLCNHAGANYVMFWYCVWHIFECMLFFFFQGVLPRAPCLLCIIRLLEAKEANAWYNGKQRVVAIVMLVYLP